MERSSSTRSAFSPGSPSSAKPGALRAVDASDGVAEPAAATGGGDEAGAGTDEVGEDLAVLGEHDGAVGDAQLQVFAVGAVLFAPWPCLPLVAQACGRKWKSSRVCTLGVDDEHDVAAVAAVAAVRAAERLELLAVHRGAAVAAGTGGGVDHHAVDESGHTVLPL